MKTSLLRTNPKRTLPLLAFLLLSRYHVEASLSLSFADLSRALGDFGNGKYVTKIPTVPLDSFLSGLVDGRKVPIVASFFAKTQGERDRPRTSLQDVPRRHSLLLPPHASDNKQQLPDPNSVFERIFKRKTFIPDPSGTNMLLVTWANWFLEELFHTEPDTQGAFVHHAGLAGTQTMTLRGLYGSDSYRESALRKYEGGLLLTDPETGGIPLLADVREDSDMFTMRCSYDRSDTSCFDDLDFFATGDERFNFHPGHLMYTELFLKEHNHIAGLLGSENPDWDDQRIFDTARVVLIHIVTKIVLEEYVSVGIAKFLPNTHLPYNPNLLRELGFARIRPQSSLEFNHLYRWHGLVSEQIDFGSDLGSNNDTTARTTVGFDQFLWKPGQYQEIGAAYFARAFLRTRMGSLEAHNTPFYLQDITVQTIQDERAQGMQGFNAYREHFGLPRLETFEDSRASDEATKALKELYASIDDVDFFVGIMTERRFDPDVDGFLSETMLTTVASFAFAWILNFDHVQDPYLYSEELLTSTGLGHIKSTNLKTLLRRHFDVELPPCSNIFQVPDATKDDQCVPPMGNQWAWHNAPDFIGLDFVMDVFRSGPYMHHLMVNMIYVLVAIMGAFLLVHHLANLRWKFYRNQDVVGKFRFTFGVVNVLTMLVTVVPYTYWALEFLYGPDMFEFSLSHYQPLVSFMLLHGFLYLIEVCARLVYAPGGWLLLIHHLIWFLLLWLAISTLSVFMLKVAFVLDMMVNYEAGLFVALLYRRFSDNLKLRIRSIRWGCGVFLATRVFQTILLIQLFVVSWDRMVCSDSSSSAQDKALYAVAVFCSGTLSALQFYPMTIYYGFYKSDTRKLQEGSKPTTTLDDTAGSEPFPVQESKSATVEDGIPETESPATMDSCRETPDPVRADVAAEVEV